MARSLGLDRPLLLSIGLLIAFGLVVLYSAGQTDVPNFAATGGLLEAWLDLVEQSIEGYRTAYHSLTNVDLSHGEPITGQAA